MSSLTHTPRGTCGCPAGVCEARLDARCKALVPADQPAGARRIEWNPGDAPLPKPPLGGSKLDKGKPPMDMLDFVALAEIAKVLQFGAQKYAADNWREGITTRRTVAAALRHLLQFVSGEKLDAETGLSHLAHAGCEIMFALNAQLTRPDLDDCYVSPNR
jgi:hypothetical protein